MNSIDLFVKNWTGKHSMIPVANTDISELESKLNTYLPESYKYLISTYGLVHSPNVLTQVCDLSVDVSAVQDFLSLEDVYSLSKLYEMSGMPKGHIVFASDCKGNMFCFKIEEGENKQQDIPVWFYDQSLCTVEKISPSFTEWMADFNSL